MTIGPYASHISGALASLIIPYVERDNLRGAGSSEEPAPLRSTVLALLPALAPVPVRGRLHVPLPVVAMLLLHLRLCLCLCLLLLPAHLVPPVA